MIADKGRIQEKIDKTKDTTVLKATIHNEDILSMNVIASTIWFVIFKWYSLIPICRNAQNKNNGENLTLKQFLILGAILYNSMKINVIA